MKKINFKINISSIFKKKIIEIGSFKEKIKDFLFLSIDVIKKYFISVFNYIFIFLLIFMSFYFENDYAIMFSRVALLIILSINIFYSIYKFTKTGILVEDKRIVLKKHYQKNKGKLYTLGILNIIIILLLLFKGWGVFAISWLFFYIIKVAKNKY